MRVVPKSIASKISFFQAHLAEWQANAGQLGVSEAQVAELAALVAEAKAAHLAQAQARSAAQSATLGLHDAIERLSEAGATVIQQVRTTARTGGEGIYNLALLPAPADPAPVGTPGTPDSLAAKLQCGALLLTWACKQPRNATGTMYQVSRQVDTDGRGPRGPFEPLGVVGKRRFLDETLPPGTRQVVYRIRAVRSTAVGASADFPVSFHHTGPKMADVMQRLRGGGAVAPAA